jgi:hypothetical protein
MGGDFGWAVTLALNLDLCISIGRLGDLERADCLVALDFLGSELASDESLTAKTVFSGLVMACRFAGWPTKRSPLLVQATMEGVVLAPSGFVITLGSFPSMRATHEFVVPRSIPTTLLIAVLLIMDVEYNRLRSKL